MSKSADFTPERIADRMAIQDTMYRWCRAIDRLDFDGIREVFHPDAIDDHGIYSGGVEGLIDWIQGRHQKIPFSMHSISNMLIEFAGPDTALVETYCLAIQRYPADGKESLAALAGGAKGRSGSATDLFALARYVDKFERRDGDWRIAHRTVVFDSSMMYEAPADGPKMGADWIVGCRGNQEDFVFQKRSELGLK